MTLITRNEASNLAACIEPIRDLVDEIVVVDTGSTDATVDIARSLGARVFETTWDDDFAAARNMALSHATGDWAFILDADDRVLPSELPKLRELFGALGTDNVGYCMRRVSLAQDGGIANVAEKPLLFQRRSDIRWAYRVHGTIAPSIVRSGGRLVVTKIGIVHTGYRDDVVLREKAMRNLRLIDRDLVDHPADPFLLFYRGTILVDLEQWTEGVVTLTMCAPLVPSNSDMGRALASSLALALRHEGRLDDGRGWCERLGNRIRPSQLSFLRRPS